MSRSPEDLSEPSPVGEGIGEFLELGNENIDRNGKPDSFPRARSPEPIEDTLKAWLPRFFTSSSMLDVRRRVGSYSGTGGERGWGGIIWEAPLR